MKYRLYTNSHSAWGGMLKTINKAKKSIYLEMYILSTDTSHTHDFFSILKEKAAQGVEVVIIADIYGSRFLKSEFVEDLRSLGAEFIFFSHWFKRTHRKILIVDRKTAFLGGVNIKEHSRDWRDLQIRVTGAPVKFILKTFANSYKRCGGKRVSLLDSTYKPLTKKIKNWVIDNWPGTNKIH